MALLSSQGVLALTGGQYLKLLSQVTSSEIHNYGTLPSSVNITQNSPGCFGPWLNLGGYVCGQTTQLYLVDNSTPKSGGYPLF